MANNKPNNEQIHTSIDEVNDTLTGLGEKVQSNPKIIVWSCIAVAAVVAAVLIYVYAIRQPGQNAANNALGQADMELLMGNDSIASRQIPAGGSRPRLLCRQPCQPQRRYPSLQAGQI